MAANFRAATGASLDRSLLITRTENLRAYRQAALITYQESDVVEGWIWTTSLSPRTCVVCLAMHNTVHPKNDPFGTHPRCRCCPRPLVKGAKVRGQTGEEWFVAQDEETHVRVLGRAGEDLYRSGKSGLEGFVGGRKHPEYGATVSRKTISEIMRSAEYQGLF